MAERPRGRWPVAEGRSPAGIRRSRERGAPWVLGAGGESAAEGLAERGGRAVAHAESPGPEEQSESQKVTGSQRVWRTEMGLGVKGADFEEKNGAFRSYFIKFKMFMRCPWRETRQPSSGRCSLLVGRDAIGVGAIARGRPRTGLACSAAATTEGPFSGPWSFCFSPALVSPARPRGLREGLSPLPGAPGMRDRAVTGHEPAATH